MASCFGKYSDYLSVVGAISVGYVALIVGRQMIRLVWETVWRAYPVDVKQYGRWAVVTGCTDGIGKSFALQLAEKGMDIVLISRSPQKLSAVAEQIVRQYQVSVKVITADFKEPDIYDSIKEQLTGLDIGILVNNVGIINRRNPEYFCETEDFEQFNTDLVHVNVLACVMMTSIVLPDMLERKRGAIINLSSISGSRPMPFFTMYSASKAFIRFFSEALNMEYSSQGVTLQVLIPGQIRTTLMSSIAKACGLVPGLMFPSPDRYVTSALTTLGRQSSTYAYWPHALQQYISDRIPDCIFRHVLLQQRNKMAELLKTE